MGFDFMKSVLHLSMLRYLKILFINLAVIAVGLEFLLRIFPTLVPFGHGWFFVHHYIEVGRYLHDAYDSKRINSKRTPLILDDDAHTLLMGDSFTRGAEVPPNEDWASKLENSYDIKILNLAVGGSSTVEQAILLENTPLPKNIKTIVVNIYENDIFDNVTDMERFRKEGIQPFIGRSLKTTNMGNYFDCTGETIPRNFSCFWLKSYVAASVVETINYLREGDTYFQWLWGGGSQYSGRSNFRPSLTNIHPQEIGHIKIHFSRPNG